MVQVLITLTRTSRAPTDLALLSFAWKFPMFLRRCLARAVGALELPAAGFMDLLPEENPAAGDVACRLCGGRIGGRRYNQFQGSRRSFTEINSIARQS